jgi:hypothetical protein
MAVGIIETCERCGESYDSGEAFQRDGHSWAYCDGGAKLRRKEKDLKEFNSKTVDERLEELYNRLIDAEEGLRNVPYYGPIG